MLAAQEALKKGDITPVLKWIKQEQEQEVREAFQKTLAVRSKGADVQEVADHYFYETLVRIHRAGEGAPYTGLKAEKPEPAIAMADEALQKGSAESLEKMLVKEVTEGLHSRFHIALEKKKLADKNVEAGRAFVEAYIDYTHYVERIMQATHGTAHGEVAPEKAQGHKHE